MYSLYFITFQRSGTRPGTKPLCSIRPEQRGTFHTQFWLIAIYIYIHIDTGYFMNIWPVSWENFFVFGQVDVVTPFRPGAFHPSSVALPGLGCGWPGHATSKDCSDSLPSSEVKFSRRTGWSCCWYRDVSWLSWGDEGKLTNNWDYDGEITGM